MTEMTRGTLTITSREPTLRITTMPNDANASGDIFGGWVMSQIDLAGAIAATQRAKGPVVTVAVKELRFIQPIFVSDLVSFYAEVTAVGNTSLTVKIDVFAQRKRGSQDEAYIKVSDATLVYVAVSEPGKPRPVPR
jgi:acyl-CoA thioesterase YciA